ncbi:MAG: hypothetical protein ACP5QR_06545 [Rhizomicrobium sp.]
MKRTAFTLLAGSLLCLQTALASPAGFNGTWKEDLSTVKMGGEPYSIRVAKGLFVCSSCVPQTTVRADGAPHALKANAAIDALSVTVLNARTIRLDEFKDDRKVGTVRFVVNKGGNSATYQSSNLQTGVTGKLTFKRLGPIIKGANLVSGRWVPIKIIGMSTKARTVTYTIADKMIAMTTPTGQSYVAPFDGRLAPFKGDAQITKVAVTLKGNTLTERDYDASKLVKLTISTLLPGGKTMKVKWTAPPLHHYGSFDMTKE